MLAGDDIIERPSDAYINVSVSIPGVPDSTIYTNAKITETNTLQNHDITFIGDNMTFSKKDTIRHPRSMFIPYRYTDNFGRPRFPWKMWDI